MASACVHARHTDDTHAFPQTTLFAVSKSKLVASSPRQLLVTEQKRTPPFRFPHLKVDASFLLTVEVFLLTVRLYYLRWGKRK